jgi:hypothetical protein
MCAAAVVGPCTRAVQSRKRRVWRNGMLVPHCRARRGKVKCETARRRSHVPSQDPSGARSPSPSTTPDTRRGLPAGSGRRTPAVPGNPVPRPSQRGRRPTRHSRRGSRSPHATHPAGRGLLTSDRPRHRPSCRGQSQAHREEGPADWRMCSPPSLSSRHVGSLSQTLPRRGPRH